MLLYGHVIFLDRATHHVITRIKTVVRIFLTFVLAIILPLILCAIALPWPMLCSPIRALAKTPGPSTWTRWLQSFFKRRF